MAASQSGVFNLQCLTDAGLPAASYRLYTYTQGTTTHKTAYTDAAGSVAHTYTSDGIGGQYIALNARGELPAPLFLTSGAYDLALKTPAGVTVWTRYAVGTADASSTLAADLANGASAAKGASLVAVRDAGGYFATKTVEAALQQLAPGVFQAPWYITKDSPVLLSLRHSVSGNIVQQWQDGTAGTATYFYRGLSIQSNSHSIQMGPATNGGSCDFLWQRSQANADPAGNRFNITFDEATDRLQMSYATTASGAPAFDSWAEVKAGLTPTLTFPAVAAQFNIGVGVKQRAAGGFECRLVPTSSTVADIKQIGGSGTTFLSFRDGAMGFFGSAGTSRPTVTGSRGGNAALDSLLSALDTLGLITNSSTA